MRVNNSQGEIFYGMHFYPGVAQYDSPDGTFRVFVSEDTIRKMNPTFAARPVFVEHVEEVQENLNTLKNEADGWVVESFFNPADGKTWAKFIIVSERGLRAVHQGYRLSNAYIPQLNNTAATWNGVEYQKVVVGGEFEHLAIVQNPRYEESVIMTPDEFKAYNENLTSELKRLANSKETGKMSKFNFFKRQKVENATDLESMIVELPKSKKEISITKLINDHDTILNMNGYANGDHMVKVGEKDEMSVNDLVKKHLEMCNEMEEMKAKNAKGDKGGEPGTGEDEIDPEVENEADTEEIDEERESMDNEALEDESGDMNVGDRGDDQSVGSKFEKKDKKISKDPVTKPMKNAQQIAQARAKAARLKNAPERIQEVEVARVDLSMDQVARGKARYGSN